MKNKIFRDGHTSTSVQPASDALPFQLVPYNAFLPRIQSTHARQAIKTIQNTPILIQPT